MDPYSLSLGLALLALAASAIALLAGWILGRGSPGGSSPLPRRATRIAAGGALALAAFSLAFHLATGHRPGTAAAMGPSRFVAEHPALIGVPAIAGLLLWAAAALLRGRDR